MPLDDPEEDGELYVLATGWGYVRPYRDDEEQRAHIEDVRQAHMKVFGHETKQPWSMDGWFCWDCTATMYVRSSHSKIDE